MSVTCKLDLFDNIILNNIRTQISLKFIFLMGQQ